MKAIVLVDHMPDSCFFCKYDRYGRYDHLCGISLKSNDGNANKRPSWCPLIHPLKYGSNDFYIYDRKYLFDNLEREIDLLKKAKRFEEYMKEE